MSDLHKPERPSWNCPEDGQPWPCELARKQLTEMFLTNGENNGENNGDDNGDDNGESSGADSGTRLAVQMAWLMDAAARDLEMPDPAKLYRRFVRWTADDRSPCGRCGKASHRALPGLPPRLFPCEFGRGGKR